VRVIAVSWTAVACCSIAFAAGAQASTAPTRGEARALKAAEHARHHPRGARIVAMRVAGRDGQYGAVIWRVGSARASAASGSKISAGTDFFSGGPRRYKPSKPRPQLRPRYFDIHATITGGQHDASYHLPATFNSSGGCMTAPFDYTIRSSETFTTDLFHVRLPGSTTRGSISSYDGNWSVQQRIGACTGTVPSSHRCARSITLTDEGVHDPDNLRIDGYEIDVGPAALLNGESKVLDDCPDGGNPGYAVLAEFALGGNVILSKKDLAAGSLITAPLGDSGFLKSLSVPHSCSGSKCDGPPNCALDTTVPVGTTCKSSYNVLGYLQVWPQAF
jgi:hypothetical protein